MTIKTFEEVAEQVCMTADGDRSTYQRFKIPEQSNWCCQLFGITGCITYRIRPEKGKEPNWFWRKMQYLCFGNKWVKDEH